MIDIATDGACKGNPGVGGWGYAVYSGGNLIYTDHGGEEHTTNNRMELIAFIEACMHIIDVDYKDKITFHIDSTYVIKGVTEWLNGWECKNFKNVKNEDLWRTISGLSKVWEDSMFVWVKGHSGNELNEKADELANLGCEMVYEYIPKN